MAVLAFAGMALQACFGAGHTLYVSPAGDDRAAGTEQAPFRTLGRAQQAARILAKDMQGDVVVNLAPGEYRLDRTLEFTEADSGRHGFRVIYRSAAGPGKARLLGSVPLKGWKVHRDGIWKIDLPPKTLFHTLYEQGRRLHKARYPNYEYHPDMPTALGRYLVTVDGTPKGTDRNRGNTRGPAWLAYRPEDAPPVTSVTKMQIEIFTGGKWDWMRDIYPVTAIDPQSHRLTFFADSLPFGVGVGARFFLEDELGLLDTAGEFFVDDKAHTLYCMPWGKGHPDQLGLAAPLVGRLIQIRGKSADACVERLCLDGLALEETDDAPPTGWWRPPGWWNTGYGLRDGALVWMSNASHVEIRNCHLKNSGRSGIMLIGHNTENLITGCWIEHTGVNGVTLCNRFLAPDGKSATTDRCEHNRVDNCRIDHVGELHTYAECVTVFNASFNDVGHCDLHDSVRYAVTLRGNTGEQYGPPVSTNYPPTKGNRLHHLRVARCGQDGGDMGALHTANLNNPGGGCVNTFEQITVADTRAIPSMKDIPPDGIFLDWPKMSMDQVFRNVEIVRPQGTQLRTHKPENGASAQTENVSWKPGFQPSRMEYDKIGVTPEFSAEYGGRPAATSKQNGAAVPVRSIRAGAAVLILGGMGLAACANASGAQPSLFHPAGIHTWDLWFAKQADVYHAFYLQRPAIPGVDSRAVGYPQVGHATSRDLIHWTDCGPILVPEHGTWNDVRIATGSAVARDGRWWIVFSGGGSKTSGIGLSQSKDLMTWTKVGDAPVVPFGKDFQGTWQGKGLTWFPIADPYIYPEPIDGWYYLVANAIVRGDPSETAGCLGMLRSRDLRTWEACAVLSYPKWFERMETPQVWQRGGRWYLYFGGAHDIGLPPQKFAQEAAATTGRKPEARQHFRGNFVFTADRLEGPYLPGKNCWLRVPGYIYKVLPAPDGRDVLLTSQQGGISLPYAVTYSADGSMTVASRPSSDSLQTAPGTR